MKQILQNLGSGNIEILDTPDPVAKRGSLVISTTKSVISSGTERMLQEFGQSNWIERARQQPDKVRMVLDKVRTDGLLPTFEAVQAKLDQPIPLGYCNAGAVIEVGEGVTGFAVGDRVASNGYHAGVVCVPENLCAKIPDPVDDESAAFTVLGAIALQGIRLAQPTLGETVVVTGLGLVGLLTVQLLKAQGCRVLGIDTNTQRVELARTFGAETVDLSKGEDPIGVAEVFSRGRGVDAVVITAATKSNEPVSQAARMCRKRGRIVLVGVTGLELSRADFFEKELTFQVSCSYGPGRYDTEYEDKGHDYPVGYVRWTEQRNFEAVLDMMADGRLDMKPLISHRFPIDQAQEAYELLGGDEPYLGIVLEYPPDTQLEKSVVLSSGTVSSGDPTEQVTVGFVGAGNYAGRVLMPAFKNAGAVLDTVVTGGGVGGVHFGNKFGFRTASTDIEQLLDQTDINAVVVATRHDSHAKYVCDALRAGKNVFVEKPLALTLPQLDKIRDALVAAHDSGSAPKLMIGFNRRFAPQVQKIHSLLQASHQPCSFVMTVNAGAIPADHWTQDPDIGGGRIVGEACHFIDLLRFLAGSPIKEHSTVFLSGEGSGPRDSASISLQFENGSIGNIQYLSTGDKSFPKERLEVFCGGGVLQLDNFRTLKGFGWPGFKKMKLSKQDKGQSACVAAFVQSIIDGEEAPIPVEEIFEVSRVSILAAQHQ